jgi:nucleotide-binding universal stress UspA family protein
MFERILVAIDGGETTRSTLETACAMADKYQSKLGILYVTKPKAISDELIREAQIERVLSTPDYSGAIDRFAYYDTVSMREEVRRAESVTRLAVEIAASVVSEAPRVKTSRR